MNGILTVPNQVTDPQKLCSCCIRVGDLLSETTLKPMQETSSSDFSNTKKMDHPVQDWLKGGKRDWTPSKDLFEPTVIKTHTLQTNVRKKTMKIVPRPKLEHISSALCKCY